MKVWLMTTEYPPYFGGGIATYSAVTTRMLRDRGADVTVFLYHSEASEDQIIVQDGIRVVRFGDDLPTSFKPLANAARLSYLYANAVLRLMAQDGAPDIIESQEYQGLAYMLLWKKRALDPLLAQIPIVVTAHSPKFVLDPLEHSPRYLLPDWWIGEMERFSLRAADRVIVPSHYLKKTLQEALPGLEADVVPNPLAIAEETPPRPIPSLQLAYIGRLQRLKGILDLFSALESLWLAGHDIHIDLVGGDYWLKGLNQSMADYLKHRYAPWTSRGLVDFHGPVPPAEVGQWLTRAGIVVVPSQFENLPYVVMEAMAAGRIVVASDTGGQRELIEHGRSGWLYTGGHSNDLQQTLLRALSMTDSERQVMGQQAQERIHSLCRPDVVFTQKLALFKGVMARASRTEDAQPALYPFIRPVEALPALTADHASTPELSVVIPFYNLGQYVEHTVQSLINVPIPSLEILIIDDGSTDPHSIATLYRIAARYPRVKIFRNANRGLARTRNYGAQMAQGTYLAFLDADDTVDPRYYPRALAILKHYHNVSFVGCWTQYSGESDEVWITWNPEPPYILYRNSVNSSALIFRRQDFLDVGQNDPEFAGGYEDYATVVSLVARGRAGVVIPETWFHYLARPDSMSHKFTNEQEIYLHSLIMAKNPDAYKQYSSALIQLMNANWPHYTNDNPSSPF